MRRETIEDVKHQNNVANRIKSLNDKIDKVEYVNEGFFDYDAVLYKGEVKCYLEVKDRDKKFLSYIESGGVMINTKKLNKLKALARDSSVMFAVTFNKELNDIFVTMVLPDAKHESEYGGRTNQTRDRTDVTNVSFLPWDKFCRYTGGSNV